jgi:hypothetical protein
MSLGYNLSETFSNSERAGKIMQEMKEILTPVGIFPDTVCSDEDSVYELINLCEEFLNLTESFEIKER